MPKHPLYAVIAAALFLSACASEKTAGITPVKKSAAVIVVAKNGAVTVDHKPVQLHSLVTTLKARGITKINRFAVEGDPGVDQKDIERVLETLMDGGLLPKDTID
ncbi:MAG: hypothetical protein WCD79_06240 [Chthoniobacteraceae bacterium]